MARAPRRVLAAVLVLLATAAGCAVGPSERPPVAVRGAGLPARPTGPTPAPGPPAPDGQHATITFSDCTATAFAGLPPTPPDRRLRAECAMITVPDDPAQPGVGALNLSVLRAGLVDGAAPVPLARRPPLLMLGDTALDPTARHAARLAQLVPAAVLARYTLVGMDRRGTGADPLTCASAQSRGALLDADPNGFDATALLEQARQVVQDCNLTLDGQLGGFSAAATGADVERLRRTLGVARLSALGTGDGADALADWARSDPDSVGRVVLDGPSAPGADEPARTEGRTRASEAAFDAFARDCTSRAGCPLGGDPRAAVTGLLAGLRAQPLSTPDGRVLTAGALAVATALGLAEPAGWPALASALATAARGDARQLLDVLDPVTGTRGTFDAILATRCNNVTRRLSPPEITELATRWRTQYPLFGGAAAVGLVACAPWPTGGVAPAPTVPAGLPALLVIGTAADPNGPQEGARDTANAFPSAVYMAWQGAGTGAYPRTACVSGSVDALLLDGRTPRPNLTCPP